MCGNLFQYGLSLLRIYPSRKMRDLCYRSVLCYYIRHSSITFDTPFCLPVPPFVYIFTQRWNKILLCSLSIFTEIPPILREHNEI